jgi:predicted metal-dependent HD superfamily phosphohydrolase
MKNNLDKLSQHWQKYWTDSSIYSVSETIDRQQEIDRIFQILVTAYSKPDRHYHNLDHIYHLLTILERFAPQLHNSIAVSLAIWFHDFVYDSQAPDNEMKSAEAAQELLQNISISTEQIDRIQQLILATQGHQIDPNDADQCIFLDADLAILGTNPAQYQAYARSIRSEYSWVSDSDYQAGRIQVLENFLQRDQLYYTELLFNELESIARSNMLQEINLLLTVNC